ncbi:spindle assembly abnormal protein 6 homolog [Salarias fasciatus]|uniref:spindle assembly abnormal protein 6 homolog n=1 Tax=Salarias fasciatus TaxID=181472 RepID=UPI00117672D4|nr:spindle assembly abnormal protein 6 homolog [Salarias fasciatus]
METLFNRLLEVVVRCRDCEDRKANVRVSIQLQLTGSNPNPHRRDLVLKLTDDKDPYFLFSLSVSEEDFQSLKVQQGLLVDFSAFPQKFIDLLELCSSEQCSDAPRFVLHLTCQSPEGPAHFSVVETNAFKHLNHLSLRLAPGSDRDVRDHLAACLSAVKAEKQALDVKLKKTEEDLSRQLSYAQQTLCERSKELEKLRSDWTHQTSSLSSRHAEELQSEREKSAELQQQAERLREELQSRLAQLEESCRDLTRDKYQQEAALRDLQTKLQHADQESQRWKQQCQAARRENGQLDSELQQQQSLVVRLQTRVAVLEQESRDQQQLMKRTHDVLEATQQQKESMKENVDSKAAQTRKLEATVKSLSEELLKANGIIQKLQAEVRALLGKVKLKNTVTVSQEKRLQDTSQKLQRAEQQLHDLEQQLADRDLQVEKLKEQLDGTVQKLNESRDVLKTNENVISWLNKQLNEKQLQKSYLPADGPRLPLTAAPLQDHFLPPTGAPAAHHPAPAPPPPPAAIHSRDSGGLDPKYFERRDDSIPVYGLSSNLLHKELPQRAKSSAYFSA